MARLKDIALTQTPCYELQDDRLEPPLGLLYLATWLSSHHYQTQIVDISSTSPEDWPAVIPQSDFFGFSTYTTTYSRTLKVLQTVKSLNPTAWTIAGGLYSAEKRSWIYEAGADWFIISLDGPEAINDRVRGTGSYRQVIETLQELGHHRPPLRVRLNRVVARHNVQTIEALARLADENGVESLNMIPLRPYGRSVKLMAGDMFDQSDFYTFIKQIQELRQRYRVQFITTLDLLDPEATTSHDLIVQKNSPVPPELRPW